MVVSVKFWPDLIKFELLSLSKLVVQIRIGCVCHRNPNIWIPIGQWFWFVTPNHLSLLWCIMAFVNGGSTHIWDVIWTRTKMWYGQGLRCASIYFHFIIVYNGNFQWLNILIAISKDRKPCEISQDPLKRSWQKWKHNRLEILCLTDNVIMSDFESRL